MRRFNTNKKRVLRELLNTYQPTAFRSIRGFNRLFGTRTNETYTILDDLVGVVVIPVVPPILGDELVIDPNLNNIRDYLYSNRGNTIQITYLIDGQDVLGRRNRKVDFNIEIPNLEDREFEDWWWNNHWGFMIDSGTSVFEEYGYQGKIYGRPLTSIATTERIKQSFLDGLSHCVFTPILSWANDCLSNAESESSKKRYKSKINKVDKYSKKYNSGVPEDEIEELCKDLNIKINISYPFTNEENNYGEKLKHADKVFNFINTRLNHLEIGNFIINKKPESVSRDFIYAKIDELESTKDFYYTTKDHRGYNSIHTLNECWSCSTDFQQTLNKFEEDNGLKNMKICDIDNTDLASFIKRGTHYNTSFRFGNVENVSEENTFKSDISYRDVFVSEYFDEETNTYTKPSSITVEEKTKTIKLIDQKKAYYHFKKCRFYEGFLGKITDFRATDKVQGVGLYLISNIKFNKNRVNDLLQKLNWIKNNNVYTSAELKLFDSYKITYKIIAGCWGIEPFHFEFGEEFLQKTDKMPFVDDNGELCMKGISYYAKATGSWDSHNTHTYRYIKGNNEYAKVLKNNSNNTIVKCNDDNEICVGVPKKNIYTLSHITAFILAYQRISLLDQLLEMDINNLVGIYVDGIYYYKHPFKLLDNFENKEIDSSVSFRNEGFLSNIFETKPKIVYSMKRENYHKELFIGAGGNGKTHYNLNDTGLINTLYVAPSHKLNANKKAEYNVSVEVLASLLTDNNIIYKRIMKFNVIIFDEVSMMSNEDKKILIKKYSSHKLIFCGDVGFQLPCICNYDNPKTPFIKEDFDNIIEFKTNYRCKDNTLLERLNELRDKISQDFKKVNHDFKDLFTCCDMRFVKENYKSNDMIICGTNKAKDCYTDLFPNMKKWYITKNTEYYNNGDIIIQEEKPDKSAVLRHAYTAHSIQGETAYHKLFIDVATLHDIKAFYTALSRATYMNQIYMVV
jgi:hypothetical protein